MKVVCWEYVKNCQLHKWHIKMNAWFIIRKNESMVLFFCTHAHYNYLYIVVPTGPQKINITQRLMTLYNSIVDRVRGKFSFKYSGTHKKLYIAPLILHVTHL